MARLRRGFGAQALAVTVENRIASLALGGIMVIPLAEILSRKFFGAAIPGSSAYASVLTLWLGMLGAAIAAREGKLLTLATGEFLPKGRVSDVAHIVAGAVGAMTATILTMGAIVLVQSDRVAGDVIAGGTPKWIADLALPVGFGLIALRLAWKASPHWLGRAIAAGGVVAGPRPHPRPPPPAGPLGGPLPPPRFPAVRVGRPGSPR